MIKEMSIKQSFRRVISIVRPIFGGIMKMNNYKTKNFFLPLFLSVSTFFSYCGTTSNSENIKSSETESQRSNINNSEDDLDRAIANLTDQIISSMIAKGKTKVVVIEFSDLQGNILKFGKYLSEELITRLFMTQKFDVIERRLLNKVLDEQKISLSGLIDSNSIRELGKILGVDAIVTGTITDLGTSIKVNARIISTETGTVFAVAATEIISDAMVKKLMGQVGVVQRQKERVTKEVEKRPVKKKVSKAGEIFYKEDFSGVEEGQIPEDWTGGYKLMVKKSSRHSYLKDFKESNSHTFSFDINFPTNFRFEYIFEFSKGCYAGACYVRCILGNLITEFHGAGMGRINKVKKRFPKRIDITTTVTIEKKKNIVKFSIAGREIGMYRYSDYKEPSRVIFEIINASNFKLLKIIGTDLGK